MSLSLNEATTPVLLQMLGGLSKLLDKAAAHCADRKIDPSAILTARLYPNMFTFQRQVQVATDWARNTAGRLAGVDVPKIPDEEKSFDDLKARVRHGDRVPRIHRWRGGRRGRGPGDHLDGRPEQARHAGARLRAPSGVAAVFLSRHHRLRNFCVTTASNLQSAISWATSRA